MYSGNLKSISHKPVGSIKTIAITSLAIFINLCLHAQSQQKMGSDAFPVNDNNASSVTAAVNGGEEINGYGKVCKIVRYSATTMFACSSSGGIYKTTDNGNTWESLTGSFLPGVQMSCLAVDPNNQNIMYAGTGEATYAQYYGWGGYGVFKSVDGGATWAVSNNGMGTHIVSDIIINRNNTSMLVAGCSDGLYYSSDAGASWSRKMASNTYMQQLAQRGNSDTIFAVSNDRFFTSTNWGFTWSIRDLDPITSVNYLNGRLAVAASDTRVVYATWIVNLSGNYTQSEIFQSLDGGGTFTKKYSVSSLPALSSYDGSVNGPGYGWANWCIAVDPANANTVYTGAHLIYKSTDGAVTFTTTIADWFCCVHTDIHDINIAPADHNTLFAANDGGIFVSNNQGVDWQPASNGLDCSQYYSFGQSHVDSTFVIGGLQDNGIIYLNDDNDLHTYAGGDYSNFTACDYFNAHNTYTNSNGGLVFDPYNRAVSAAINLPADVLNGSSETPVMEFSQLNPGRAFCYNTDVWITDNLDSYTMNSIGGNSSVSWAQLTSMPQQTILTLDIAPNNDNLIYFVSDNGMFYTCTISNGSLQNITSIALPGPATLTATITVSTLNPDVIYVVADNKVYRSANGGKYFYDMTYNLPPINFQSIYLDPYSTVEGAYLVTDLGVYYGDLTLFSWLYLNDGFPDSVQNANATFYQLIAGSGIYKGSNSATSHVSMGTWGAGFQKANFYVQKCNDLWDNFSLTNYGPQFSTATACRDDNGRTHGGLAAYTVVTNGGSIGGNNDQFSMVQGKFTRDGTMNFWLISVEKGDTNHPCETGLMMRANSAAADAPFVMIGANGNNRGFLRYRSATGGNTVDSPLVSLFPVAYPATVKLTRTGNTYIAYYGGLKVGQVDVFLGDTIIAGAAASAGISSMINHTAFSDFIDSGFRQLPTDVQTITNAAAGLYPDPAHNYVTIKLSATGGLTYQILDVLGKIQLTGSVPANTTNYNIDISHLASGNYFINLTDGNTEPAGKLRFVKY